MRHVSALGLVAVALAAAAWAAGCGGHQDSAREGEQAARGSEYVLASPPADALEVAAARADAQDGQELAVHGRVGEYVEGRTMFRLVDASLAPCSDNPEDNCPTPWDYCCVPPEELTASTVTVRFVDRQGESLTEPVEGFAGIEHLATVTVVGTAARDEAGNVSITARGVYRHASGDSRGEEARRPQEAAPPTVADASASEGRRVTIAISGMH